ncbi:unnamed protein product [Sordaria macrospora k-hell]|uniref:WGS project CABT00000000 data, contig 2.64 n=1 Tax=Sordaria macrospora (strain ATCC MYA-333 / DSM 997 / K(L3346) / K-hell) TaxID=771870 RepID=F7WAS2_SORMK|nr:uncharacterized protein SMAC_08745 [Sordaria macrospora k-hell]CCC05381.1 unnamed protein product [Sordaria macrospora k-hell]
MPGQTPEVVASADLSPLSPKPIALHSTSPTLVPRLQDHAAAIDAVVEELTNQLTNTNPTSQQPSYNQYTSPTMPEPVQESSDVSDTIVVAGEYSEDDNDSLDAYDEDGQDQSPEHEQDNKQGDKPETGSDDYAHTFDSPTDRGEEGEADETQPDVSKASETMMNDSSTSDPSKTQPSTAPTSDPSSSPPVKVTSQTKPHSEAEQLSVQTNESLQSLDAPSDSAPAAPQQHLQSSNPDLVPDATLNGSSSMAEVPPAQDSRDIQMPDAPHHDAQSSTKDSAAASNNPTPANEDDDTAVDIQKLVDNITARAAASPTTASTTSVAAASSKPPATQTSQNGASILNLSPGVGSGTPRTAYMSTGGPGIDNGAISSLPPIPPNSFNNAQAQPYASAHNSRHALGPGNSHISNIYTPASDQDYEKFLVDERQYTLEARWEQRFPEGSRIFIGNLSCERVSKREVFDVFSKFGRLAQISLKNAYGFVQYHTIEEGLAAIRGCRDIELGGRAINLEISKKQDRARKEHSDHGRERERERSPDRRPQRDTRIRDRYEARDPGWRRDDYRPGPGRSPSPRRGSRDGRYARDSRDRDFGPGYDSRRSRSPPPGRYYDNGYRRRDESPHRRVPSSEELDMPFRYGADVPDVQLVLLGDVHKEYVSWAQGIFHAHGLRTDVIYANPRFPREPLIQRQMMEGVHAVSFLDSTSPSRQQLDIRVFTRTRTSINFDDYKVTPQQAAALVVEKKRIQPPQPQPTYPSVSNYDHGRGLEVPPPVSYPYPQQHYAIPPAPVPQIQPPAPVQDLSSVVGQLNNESLSALLATLSQSQGVAHQQPHHPSMPYGAAPAPAAPQAAQIDMNALLGNLRSAANPGVASYGEASQGYGSVLPLRSRRATMPSKHRSFSTSSDALLLRTVMPSMMLF